MCPFARVAGENDRSSAAWVIFCFASHWQNERSFGRSTFGPSGICSMTRRRTSSPENLIGTSNMPALIAWRAAFSAVTPENWRRCRV
ncbi:hypothetical protein D3C80_1293100 [compost metagenome]